MINVDLPVIQSIFKPRRPNSHKGNHGHAMLICGCNLKMGAAIIAASACLRSGVGLLTLNIPKKERQAVFSSIPEAMVHFRELEFNSDHFNAIAFGSGVGLLSNSETLLDRLLILKSIPLVLDADALTLLSQHPEKIQKLPFKTIITPHVKEFDRLFGEHDTDEERISKAISKAGELNIIIVLKNHKTIITDGVQQFINTTGNSGLAKSGSGDALTGIITALLAQGYTSLNAAVLGVFIHGMAANLTLNEQSPESMLITDVIKNIGRAFQQI